eukprot:6789864-Pyramimonas_sp.AAC.1
MILVHMSLRTCGQLALNSELVVTRATLGALPSGDYLLLWVATPADWHVRLPGKQAGPQYYQRIHKSMIKAWIRRMSIVLVGPPGFFWRQGPMRESIEDLETCRSCVCDAATSVCNVAVL